MMTDMLTMGVPLLEKVARALAVYFFLLVAFRFAGKRLLAQLNPFDLVLILILSNAVQNAIIGPDDSVVGGLVGAAVLLLANGAMVRLLYNYPKLELLVEGCETKLMDQGHVLDDALRRELMTKSGADHRRAQAGRGLAGRGEDRRHRAWRSDLVRARYAVTGGGAAPGGPGAPRSARASARRTRLQHEARPQSLRSA